MLSLTLSMEKAMSMHELCTEVIHHISSTRPRAKKEYKCSCCNGIIPKGEKHYKNVYKIGKDDKIRWERAHIKCPGWE